MSEPTPPPSTPRPPRQSARKATATAGAPAPAAPLKSSTTRSLLEEARELAEQQPNDNSTDKERNLEKLMTLQAELTDEILVFNRAKRALEEQTTAKIDAFNAEIANCEAKIEVINEQLREAGQPVVATTSIGKKQPEPSQTKLQARAEGAAKSHPRIAGGLRSIKKGITTGKTFEKGTHKTI